ncbi:hypothetical protein DOTSEDRAFT_47149 [Dothistroma septosporum NZE10]|uniref:Uncharacterized protein n=1 Tax=Dothistroma septosporum (strain NZE10 / CBS 128990) TaxID=675120 RepID=N1PH57_DOTSN|nr:hypothetical protein DOTSEDRAFT_47149 [Dothistroma septosporum NZE10]
MSDIGNPFLNGSETGSYRMKCLSVGGDETRYSHFKRERNVTAWSMLPGIVSESGPHL